jgi:hypothetical protein
MAQRFIEQATQQVAPLYDQQISAAEGQIPQIQNLYNTLIGGLRGESERQLATGTQGIVEDASRRGVLRSTLPVDARTELQGAISSALTQGLGNLNLQQLENVRGIQGQIGQLRLGRQGAIQSLSESLQQADLREREFAMQQEAAREAARRAQAAQATDRTAFENLIATIRRNAALQQPTLASGPTRPDLASIFGSGSSLRVGGNTQQNLLQPAGRVNVQPAANARTFQPAAPVRRTVQPRLQGAGAVSGTLRVR